MCMLGQSVRPFVGMRVVLWARPGPALPMAIGGLIYFTLHRCPSHLLNAYVSLLSDMSGDARRTRQPGGAPECALAAARNASRKPGLTREHIHNQGYAGEYYQTTGETVTKYGITWRARVRSTQTPNTVKVIHWVKFLKHEVATSTQRVHRAPCGTCADLNDHLISFIEVAILGEDRGLGPDTHATTVVRDPFSSTQPSWSYYDNEASAYPAPRPSTGARMEAPALRTRIRSTATKVFLVTNDQSPLDNHLTKLEEQRERDGRLAPISIDSSSEEETTLAPPPPLSSSRSP